MFDKEEIINLTLARPELKDAVLIGSSARTVNNLSNDSEYIHIYLPREQVNKLPRTGETVIDVNGEIIYDKVWNLGPHNRGDWKPDPNTITLFQHQLVPSLTTHASIKEDIELARFLGVLDEKASYLQYLIDSAIKRTPISNIRRRRALAQLSKTFKKESSC